MDRIVILGAGTAGTLVANRLRRRLGAAAEITVVDRDDRHLYQPALLFLPFGLADPRRIVRSRAAQLHEGIEFGVAECERIDLDASRVRLVSGAELPYDVLVVATGAELLPDETDGLTGPGWGERVFTFYDLEGATALRDALRRFQGGRLVVDVVDMPIKCPVAPLEFCFLADWQLRRRGIRDAVDLVYVTPLDAAFTKPVAARHLADLLAAKGISLETEFAAGSVDGGQGRLVSYDEREVPFDLLVTIPAHGGAPFLARSPGLADELGFVATDPHTLQAKAAPNVFAVGDATNLPISKAGSAAHFQAETVLENVQRALAGQPPAASYDGHANCFVETGFHKALLIDFDYDAEPMPGRYPHPRAGPLPLLRESRLNHLAKLAMEPVYWHALLPALPRVQAKGASR